LIIKLSENKFAGFNFKYLHFLKLRKTSVIFLLFISSLVCFSQASDTLYINYYVDAPFAFVDKEVPTGIEIDIINEYASWLKSAKKMNVTIKYTPFTDFDLFYSTTKKAGKNTLGLGGITVTPDKAKEVDITTPYLKNVAFCITNGNAPDIKTKTPGEIIKTLGSMTALTVAGTNLNNYVNEIKKTYVNDLKIVTHPDQKKILDEIAKSVLR